MTIFNNNYELQTFYVFITYCYNLFNKGRIGF
jgi:hypothetical protein